MTFDIVVGSDRDFESVASPDLESFYCLFSSEQDVHQLAILFLQRFSKQNMEINEDGHGVVC